MFLEVQKSTFDGYFDNFDLDIVHGITHRGLFDIDLGDEISPEVQETGFLGYITFHLRHKLKTVSPSFICPFGKFKNENDKGFSLEESWKNELLRRRIGSTIESLLFLQYPGYQVSMTGLASTMSLTRYLQMKALGWVDGMPIEEASLGALQKPMRGATIAKWPDWISQDVREQILQLFEKR